MTRTEKWRAIDSHPAYQVSDRGRVRRLLGSRYYNSSPDGILKTVNSGRGYRVVTLYLNGKPSIKRVSTLVAKAFLGPKPSKGHQVAHHDGTRDNDRATNLRWATPRENAADKVRHGRAPIGVRNPSAKLTEEDVLAIRARLSAGHRQSEIAKDFGVTDKIITRIKRRQLWAHVDDAKPDPRLWRDVQGDVL